MVNQVQKTTAHIITELYREGEPNKAVFASLRGAADLTSRRAQVVWPFMMANLPTAWLSRDGVPTEYERAIYTTLRLFAIDQYGNNQPVFATSADGGQSIFAVLAVVRQDTDSQNSLQASLDRRVVPLLGMTDIGAVINALTHLVEIIKAKGVGATIDFSQLAAELVRFQQSYEKAVQVRLMWGQSYYATPVQTDHRKGENHDH